MRLRQLTGLEQDKLRAEYEEIQKLIAYLNEILTNEELRMKVIKDELIEIREKYGDERRSEIIFSAEEMNPEDFYADEEMVITISHMGYIKRTPLTEFHTQNRGGVGARGSDTRDEDFVEYIYPATTHNYMLFFTQKGKCYWLRVFEIPEGSKNSKGRAIQNLLNIDPDDSVTAFIRVETLQDEEYINSNYLLFCTEKGVVKKTLLEAYSRPRQNGVNAITIREDDQVISVRLTDGKQHVILANRNGRAIRFNEEDVRPWDVRLLEWEAWPLTRMGKMPWLEWFAWNRFRRHDSCVSEQGYGKRTMLNDEEGEPVYRITRRGGKGLGLWILPIKQGSWSPLKAWLTTTI